MDFLTILKIIAVLGTIATGVWVILKPYSAQGFTGLSIPGGRGATELRAAMGGLFLALGLATQFVPQPYGYQVLGFAYLGIAIIRLPAMFIDRSVVQSNLISLAVEVVFGVILLV
jgi:hypothetical protein